MFTEKRCVEKRSEVSKVQPLGFVNEKMASFLTGSYGSPESPQDSPSSSFHNGFCSNDDGGSPFYKNGLPLDATVSPSLDGQNMKSEVVDEGGLCESFNGMDIRGGGDQTHDDNNRRMKGFESLDHVDLVVDDGGFRGVGDCVEYDVKRCGPYDYFKNNVVGFGFGDSLSSVGGVPCRELNGFGRSVYDSMGSFLGPAQTNTSFLLEQRNEQRRQALPGTFRPCVTIDAFVYSQQCNVDCNSRRRSVKDTLSTPHIVNDRNTSTLDASTRPVTNIFSPQSLSSLKNRGNGDALNFLEDTLRPAAYKGKNFLNEIAVRNLRGKITGQENRMLNELVPENGLPSYGTPHVVPTVNSLSEAWGYLYLMAQDQHGCRFLQSVIDAGTDHDTEMIFDELINHVVELVLNPFANYLIQKLLDVCNEKQRLRMVMMLTEESGQLVCISLNTYGTRVVQKLIETVKTKQQIARIVIALRPGFLDLIKDQNGNHVIQRCLQCLSNEDIKFIFDVAAKYCVEMATHQHGCCVMQRCISYATWRYRDKLTTEISKNALVLAQDPFGNYVIQYIIELKNPTATANLLSQFKGNYISLSMQKFSSHVVEKCLKHIEASRWQIIRELLSFPRLEQLLQDQFANYVIQSALGVIKGPLRASLVEALRPHSTLRSSPYCKRIFSRNLFRN